jgi:hypothetical protein
MAAFAIEGAPLLAEEAAVVGRGIASRAARRQAISAASKFFGRAYRTGSKFVRKNPFTAGMLAQYGLSKAGNKKKRRKAFVRKMGPAPKRRKTIARGNIMDIGHVRFKRGVRPRKASKYVKRKYDHTGVIDDTQCCWLGVQSNGGFDAQFTAIADAMARAIFASVGVYPIDFNTTNTVDGCATTDTVNLKFNYRGIVPSTGDEDNFTGSAIAMPNTTLANLSSAIATEIKTQALAGRYPDAYSIENVTKGLFLKHDVELAKARVELYFTSVLQIQNQSKAPTDAAGGHEDVASRFNIHSQPVNGKKYVFRHAAAELKPEFHGLYSDADPFQDEVVTDGISTISVGDSGANHLKHAVPANAIFTNCKEVAPVALAPGQVKKEVATLKYVGTLQNLFNKIMKRNSTGSERTRAWGAVTWFAFERAIRHGTGEVDIAYNREMTISSHLQLKPQRHTLISYDN